MRFVLRADRGGIKIKIPYNDAGSYSISANGVPQEYTPWDKELGRHGELPKVTCGENRYVGVENFLEFYLTTDCEITVVPRDSIMVSVRLDWTLAEFYASGGVTTFTDRMAAVLGVHASQIKTVAVYEGSVVIEYLVEALPDDEEPAETLSAVQLNFVEAVAAGLLDLGAPVMDAAAGGRPIQTGYDGDHYGGKDGNLWDDLIADRDNQDGDDTQDTSNTGDASQDPSNGGSSGVDQDSNSADGDTSANSGSSANSGTDGSSQDGQAQ